MHMDSSPISSPEMMDMSLLIEQNEVQDFAKWSGDRNPIHVDADAGKASAFGGNIVHGALSTLVALRQLDLTASEHISGLAIEFRAEVRPGEKYAVEVNRQSDGSSQVVVGESDRPSMLVRVETSSTPSEPPTAQWIDLARASGLVSSGADDPARWSPEQFRLGEEVHGIHQFGHFVAEADDCLSAVQSKVLGLCSFMVGMKAPGLSSLFTKLEVTFHSEGVDADQLAYRFRFCEYDRHFRLLHTQLEICDLSGSLIATAEVHSYVRFPISDPDPAALADLLDSKVATLHGKVALVCGASRGLGAELAAALGAAKCHVYLACRRPTETTDTLVSRIVEQGGSAEVIAGDVGDPAWCAAARTKIEAKHGGLDLLILNACAPLTLTDLADNAPEAGECLHQFQHGAVDESADHILKVRGSARRHGGWNLVFGSR